MTREELEQLGWEWVIDHPQHNITVFSKEKHGGFIFCELRNEEQKIISKMNFEKYSNGEK